ncbi:MAG: hypothetical protein LBD10_09800 [Desulfobulbus sp.]|jgi:hypothetical protein|uniref:hypothetical protein n=1 Tax=Desulfobulbus sp. TaxID=895 RepID=UPI002844F168|nr:hypothetical protein [Desulfobulbus sp.]MDR2550475.1 hypothetical protein [Desulfobulbus sp.]
MALLTKPGVPRTVHLFAAPFLWTAIGGLLMARGWGWLEPGRGRLLFVAAGLLGTLKSLFILDKIARRSLDRIVRFQDGTCLGAVYSWKTWLLVLLMMATGIILRSQTEPGPVIGILYGAVGWSLCLSSRLGWREWYHRVHPHGIA